MGDFAVVIRSGESTGKTQRLLAVLYRCLAREMKPGESIKIAFLNDDSVTKFMEFIEPSYKPPSGVLKAEKTGRREVTVFRLIGGYGAYHEQE